MNDAAKYLRARLNGDLLSAMKSRDSVAMSALRSLLAALDNASAVPVTASHVPVFGRSGDVPRRVLSGTECQSIVSEEVHIRQTAVAEYERLGHAEEAARLRAELAVIARYVGNSRGVPNNPLEPTR